MTIGNEVLDDSYKVDSGMLIEEIEALTVVRRTVTVSPVLDPDDLQIDVETLVDDLVVNMGLDPNEARRSTMALTRVTKTVPEIDMEFSWSPSQIARINRSKVPISQRIAKGTGKSFPKFEDAMFLAATLTGTIGDIQAVPSSTDYHTAATNPLDLTTYATMKSTLAGMIGQLITGIGNIKPFPLYLYVTPIVYNRLLGIGNATSDRNGVEYVNATLKTAGSPLSEVVVTPNLGCTLTKTKAGLAITVADESSVGRALLMASNGQFQTIFSSAFKHPMELTPVRGYYSKIYERWLPTVHQKLAAIWDVAVDYTA